MNCDGELGGLAKKLLQEHSFLMTRDDEEHHTYTTSHYLDGHEASPKFKVTSCNSFSFKIKTSVTPPFCENITWVQPPSNFTMPMCL